MLVTALVNAGLPDCSYWDMSGSGIGPAPVLVGTEFAAADTEIDTPENKLSINLVVIISNHSYQFPDFRS